MTGTDLAGDPDYRLFCEERLEDPYPLFHRLRAADPVHWCEPGQYWLLTRYADVFPLLSDPRLSSNRMAMYHQNVPPDLQQRVQPLLTNISNWLILLDAPDHVRLRRLVNVAFTPRMLTLLKPRIEQVADELLQQTIDQADGRPVNILETFCYPLPATVICDMLGLPPEEHDNFRRWAGRVVDFSTRAGPPMRAYAEQANENMVALIGGLNRLIDHRRRRPGEDLMSGLITAEEDGDRLNHDELLALGVFLFIAGHETTMHLIANGLLSLLQHPDQFEKLKTDVAGKVERTVEELLRYDNSVTRAVRQAKEDIEVAGKLIRRGQTLVLLLGAANRDPAQFTDPDRLDIERHPNKHASLGWGPHFCLGGQLARLEIDIALRGIVRLLPEVRLAEQDFAHRPTFGIRALDALWVKV